MTSVEEKTKKPIVRHATREDVAIILDLIHQLADYEHASSSVEATQSSLLSTLSFPPFPSSGYARTLLLFPPDSKRAAGMALYFYNYSTWRAKPGVYIEDLFVRKDFRGRGYGSRLLAELAREVVRGVDGARLEWSVLKWNEPSIRFYKSIGAKTLDEWESMRVDGDALNELAEQGEGLSETNDSGS